MPDSSIWVSDPAQLRTFIDKISGRIGLDTEFIRERTYWPQLALVQIAIDDGPDPTILLVDPLADGIAGQLRPLLQDPAITKVMHSASEDLVALQHACHAVPEPLFDTQVAAALSGIGAGIGYQRLVQDIAGHALPKGQTRSDWRRRPLSAEQLDYAADDVRHLFALHDALGGRIDALGRRGWLEEDCARMLAIVRNSEGERWPHLSMRAAQHLDAGAQHRLLRLLRWREAQARDSDRPRNWILDNELATVLAREAPKTPESLRTMLQRHPRAPIKLAGKIWDALSTPLPDEDHAPRPRPEDTDKRTLRKLQEAVTGRSAELGLPDGILASRRWLEALLDGGNWPGPLGGWRRRELEPVLAPLLEDAGDKHDVSV